MSKDLGPILHGWDFNSGQVIVRLITGDDGKQKVQLRLDLGLLQMEMDGRPDGLRPEGFESFFDLYQSRAREFMDKVSDEPRFTLSPTDCARLQQEAVQYYHRYLALFQVGDWMRVIRDTQRNLNLFDFVEQNTESVTVSWLFQQFRPYVLMMLTRARGQQALDNDDTAAAHQHITDGIRDIRNFYDLSNHPEMLEQSQELQFLETWKLEVEKSSPSNELVRLEKALTEAVQKEDYEAAAKLRDDIKNLKHPKDASSQSK
jgi:hypothetical protein